jgi:hypothetical protein
MCAVVSSTIVRKAKMCKDRRHCYGDLARDLGRIEPEDRPRHDHHQQQWQKHLPQIKAAIPRVPAPSSYNNSTIRHCPQCAHESVAFLCRTEYAKPGGRPTIAQVSCSFRSQRYGREFMGDCRRLSNAVGGNGPGSLDSWHAPSSENRKRVKRGPMGQMRASDFPSFSNCAALSGSRMSAKTRDAARHPTSAQTLTTNQFSQRALSG